MLPASSDNGSPLDYPEKPSSMALLPTAKKYADQVIESHQVGVSRLFIAWDKPQAIGSALGYITGYITEYRAGYLPTLYRLLSETYRIAPALTVLRSTSLVWSGVSTAIDMAIGNRLLRVLETVLVEKTAAPESLLWSLGLLASWSIFSTCVTHYQYFLEKSFETRVMNYFHFKITEENIRRDITTSKEEDTETLSISAMDVREALSMVSNYVENIISLTSQVAVAARIASNFGGPLVPVAALTGAVLQSVIGKRNIWDAVCLAYVTNKEFRRATALETLAGSTYRDEVVSGNLAEWIIPEYRLIRDKLLDVSLETEPIWEYGFGNTPLGERMVSLAVQKLPFMCSIGYAMAYPASFSLSGIAMSQTACDSIQNSLATLLMFESESRQRLGRLRDLYVTMDAEPEEDGKRVAYPTASSSPAGMAFELRDVQFSYPGTQNKELTLKCVNLSIDAGQIVVIVGSNGSGKSTLIRLLSGGTQPTAGSVLVDGIPSTSYHLDSFRRSCVVLSQTHCIFPLSFTENIGLGDWTQLGNLDLIKTSADKGGARAFIEKLETGFDTVLDPLLNVTTSNLTDKPDHPLYEQKEKLEKKLDISGGEKQRVVASRAFMRMNSNKVRFVAVDEPTSALDPEGEINLFHSLLEEREGKTMVFVTHRFGYLTKQADVIVCMKNGEIVEVGKHSELIKRTDGEYAKLYNIQAAGFIEQGSS